MRTFGIILVLLGVVACLLPVLVGMGSIGESLEATIAVAGVGIVGAGAAIVRNS